ncbi:hypothetical protein GCM10028794_24320 [Silanimonas algicola]
MKKRTEKSTLQARLYMSHVNYHATGEGVRSCLAIAESGDKADGFLKDRLPGYFHALIVTGPAETNARRDILAKVERSPAKVRDALAEMPPGAAEYYSELH